MYTSFRQLSPNATLRARILVQDRRTKLRRPVCVV